MTLIRHNLLVLWSLCTIVNLIWANSNGDKGDEQVPTGERIDATVLWQLPTILIVTLFRNKAHVLPYFFSHLDRLDYPKNRISLW